MRSLQDTQEVLMNYDIRDAAGLLRAMDDFWQDPGAWTVEALGRDERGEPAEECEAVAYCATGLMEALEYLHGLDTEVLEGAVIALLEEDDDGLRRYRNHVAGDEEERDARLVELMRTSVPDINDALENAEDARKWVQRAIARLEEKP